MFVLFLFAAAVHGYLLWMSGTKSFTNSVVGMLYMLAPLISGIILGGECEMMCGAIFERPPCGTVCHTPHHTPLEIHHTPHTTTNHQPPHQCTIDHRPSPHPPSTITHHPPHNIAAIIANAEQEPNTSNISNVQHQHLTSSVIPRHRLMVDQAMSVIHYCSEW
jgi:hypothetical protein